MMRVEKADNLGVLKLGVHRYDIDFIELMEGQRWTDLLPSNQTEHLFFTISSQNAEERRHFDVVINSSSASTDFKFMLCLEKTIEKCKQAAIDKQTGVLSELPI
jgi:hypothetical protein